MLDNDFLTRLLPFSAAVLLAAALFPAAPATASPGDDAAASVGSTFSHDEWTTVLQEFVDERGFVDYDGLAQDRDTFDAYLAKVRAVSPRSHPDKFPTEDHELAYWINAYNAHVFNGVLDRGPEDDSVWGWFLRTGKKFFTKREVVLGGETTNLKKLEDDWIREGYGDPRIHAAINCASVGCPRLPQTAFTGPELDEQLDAAMREFVAEPRNVELSGDGETVTLSKIFEWFEGDFTAEADSVVDYVNRYRAEDAQIPAGVNVEYRKYDKDINAQ